MEMVDEREIGIVQMSKSLFHLEYLKTDISKVLSYITEYSFEGFLIISAVFKENVKVLS